ncbi:hypothetical protein ABZX98_13415 [Streptomyces sp. NPDC002992]|uniref:hypothetical protein n=1 Tax=Streptomyces sp. NPDC002992 TaxID=3154273 RepID=UPI0033B784CD
MRSIGLVLADSVPSTDRDSHLDGAHERMHQLWSEAATEGRTPTRETLKAAIEETWAGFSRLEGWARYVLTDRHGLKQPARCPILAINLRSGLVTVVVSTPDWETLEIVEDPQEWHRLFQTAVIQKLDYYLHVEIKLVPGFDVAANPCPRLSGGERSEMPAAWRPSSRPRSEAASPATPPSALDGGQDAPAFREGFRPRGAVLQETLGIILADASMEERAVCEVMVTTGATQEEIAQRLGTTLRRCPMW